MMAVCAKLGFWLKLKKTVGYKFKQYINSCGHPGHSGAFQNIAVEQCKHDKCL